MGNPFIDELNDKNLSTYFLLPLMQISFRDFGEANFLNSYVVAGEGEEVSYQVAVHIIDPNLCLGIAGHPCFVETIHTEEQSSFIIMQVGEQWHTDFDSFVQGKYSKFSELAKNEIILHSGLKYQYLNADGSRSTDARLMALDKHPSLAEKWLEILGRDTTLPDELLSKPSKRSFIQIKRGEAL
jgi:hypothetical protein